MDYDAMIPVGDHLCKKFRQIDPIAKPEE